MIQAIGCLKTDGVAGLNRYVIYLRSTHMVVSVLHTLMRAASNYHYSGSHVKTTKTSHLSYQI